MDISNFMSWFIGQVVSIFTRLFAILQSIQFLGTNMLELIIAITILGALLPVILTIPTGMIKMGVNSAFERRSVKKDDSK